MLLVNLLVGFEISAETETYILTSRKTNSVLMWGAKKLFNKID